MFRTKKGAEVMIIVNTDTEDRLINVQVVKVSGFEIIDNIVKGFILNFANMKLAGKQCLLIAFVFQMG